MKYSFKLTLNYLHKKCGGLVTLNLWHTPNFSQESNASPKMKTMKKEEVGIHFLVCNTLRVEGFVGDGD